MNKSILKYSSALAALLLITSCSSSGGGGAVTNAVATNTDSGSSDTDSADSSSESNSTSPVSEVSSSNGVLSGGGTAQYDADTKTITLDGKKYTFSENPTTSGNHLSTNNELFLNSPTSGQKYSFIPAYAIGENLQTESETVSETGIALYGDLTPVADLPTSKVNYAGNWFLLETIRDSDGKITEIDSAVGKGLTATADFGVAQKVTGSLMGDEGATAALVADISGNTFSGDITMPDSTKINTSGGFFGPSAEELTGTGKLSLSDPSGESAEYSLGYYGTKQEVPDG